MRTKFGKSSCTSTSPDTSTCLLLHALITHGFKGNHDAQVRVFKIRRKKTAVSVYSGFIYFVLFSICRCTHCDATGQTFSDWHLLRELYFFIHVFCASLIIPILFYLKQNWGSVAVELLRAKVVSPLFFLSVILPRSCEARLSEFTFVLLEKRGNNSNPWRECARQGEY